MSEAELERLIQGHGRDVNRGLVSSIKELQSRHLPRNAARIAGGRNSSVDLSVVVSDDVSNALCSNLEALFLHGLKGQR